MRKKRFLLGALVIALVFGMTVLGCEEEVPEEKKDINQALVGKWEMMSMTISGTKYDLPYPDAPIGISSAGYEYTTSTYKYFANGSIIEQYSGVYSDGDHLYLSTGQEFGFTWQISNNTLTLTRTEGISAIMICKKVSNFSWE